MARKRGEEKKRKKFDVRREVSAGGVIWRRRQAAVEVVLVKPAGKNNWVLPKGHVESGETILAAALREANEETGLKVEAGDPLGNVSYIYSWRIDSNKPAVRIFKRVHFYLMRCVGGDTAGHDDEIDEVQWVPLDSALNRATHKSERDLIAKARQALTALASAAPAPTSSLRQS